MVQNIEALLKDCISVYAWGLCAYNPVMFNSVNIASSIKKIQNGF
jgi:hypothetical protein